MHLFLGTICAFLLYLPTNEANIPAGSKSMIVGKCKEFGLKNGEVRIELGWECFPNKTAVCFQQIEDCGRCDGEMTGTSVDVSNEKDGPDTRTRYACKGMCEHKGVHQTGSLKESTYHVCGEPKEKLMMNWSMMLKRKQQRMKKR
eukprot:TRINITY_DN10991_c0_g1_i1.p1 TRINITY_DN10991_c0_g1~~TRINITY_DN10991_c0_g1_i1.p1  ORF type:complete len:145 (-),score=20.38 TRINITY_DN10991_c0_g1_i1:190-624(-)